jgi:hypothetical protein
MLAVVLVAGCMTGGPVDSVQTAIVEGDWVLIEDSEVPVLAETVAEGVSARPVDLVIVSKDLVLACDNGVPMGGYDPTDDDDDPDGEDPPSAFRPDDREHNAPAQVSTGDDGPNAGLGADPSDAFSEGSYDDEDPLDNTNLDALRPLPEGMWLIHLGCL